MNDNPIIMRRELINGIEILCTRPSQITEETLAHTLLHFSQLVEELSQGAMSIQVNFNEKRLLELEKGKTCSP